MDEPGSVVAMISGPMRVRKKERLNIAAYVEAGAGEIASHIRLMTYEVVPRPTRKRFLGAFMQRIAKNRSDGALVEYNSRLVINGRMQVQGMEFHKSNAPVVGLSSLRVSLAESSRTKKIFHTIDIGTAFLDADVSEELFAVIPRELWNVGDHRTHCLRLNKSIYGLRLVHAAEEGAPVPRMASVKGRCRDILQRNRRETVFLGCICGLHHHGSRFRWGGLDNQKRDQAYI